MFIGFEGTVGGEDLASAGWSLVGERSGRIWRALNEPVPVERYKDSALSREAGGVTERAIRQMPPVHPALMILKPAANLVGRAVGGATSAVQAIGDQVGKVADGFSAGSLGSWEDRMEGVKAQRRLLEAHGFIHQLYAAYRKRGRAEYMPGPTTLGSECPTIVKDGVQRVLANRRAGEELIVAGYSRGGLNAINACNELARRGQSVQLLILFDPVDRETALGSCNISAAVQNCILVQREGNWITWKPYIREVKVVGLTLSMPDVWMTNSRWWFGRMVTLEDRERLTHGHLEHAEFDATHAAFGGVPWTGDQPGYMTERGDRFLAQRIAETVNGFVSKLGGWNPQLNVTSARAGR